MNILSYYAQNTYPYTQNTTSQQTSAIESSEVLVIVGLILLYIFIFTAAILIELFAAYMISSIVVEKGYTMQETHAFAKCFWLGIIGYIYVLGLPNRKKLKQEQQLLCTLQHIEAKMNHTPKF